MAALIKDALVKEILGLAPDDHAQDAQIAALIGAASELINLYLRRKLEFGEYEEQTYQQGKCLWLRAYPVENVISITSGRASVAIPYTVDKVNGLVYAASGEWPETSQGYTVHYRGGLKDIPLPVQQACLLLVTQLRSLAENGGRTVASERIGDYSITYATGGSAAGGGAGMETFSPAVTALLRPYVGRHV